MSALLAGLTIAGIQRPVNNWHALTLPLGALAKRPRFTVFVPNGLPSDYKLETSQIVWVPHFRFRARQAVWLRYAQKSSVMDIIEAPKQEADPDVNLLYIFAGRYFELSNDTFGRRMNPLRFGTTDVLLVIPYELEERFGPRKLDRFLRSFTPLAKPGE